MKFKKEVGDLKKTNNHLKREREKYLTMANDNARNVKLMQAKTDIGESGSQPQQIPPKVQSTRGGRFSVGAVSRIKSMYNRLDTYTFIHYYYIYIIK